MQAHADQEAQDHLPMHGKQTGGEVARKRVPQLPAYPPDLQMLGMGTILAIERKMADLYISNRRRFVEMRKEDARIPFRNGKWQRLSDNEVRRHISREIAIAIYGGAKASKFVCFDIDDGSRVSAQAVMCGLVRFGIPEDRIYLSTSGGKGYHVEVFFEPFAYTDQLKRLYRWILRETGLTERQVEFRPTEGQAIKLPLCAHHKTGNICWYLDRHTFVPVPSAEYILSIEKVPEADFLEACRVMTGALRDSDEHHRQMMAGRAGRGKAPADGIRQSRNRSGTDKPPIHDGCDYRNMTEPGTRHGMMRDIAVHQRCNGQSKEICRDVLTAWYDAQDSALIKSTREEVMGDMAKILGWVYGEGFYAGNGMGWKGGGVISKDGMRRVIRQPSRCARKVCFLMIARDSAGCGAVGVQDLARALEMTETTVRDTLRRLVRNGIIDVQRGKRHKRPDGGFRCKPNAYRVVQPEPQAGDSEGVTFHAGEL